jgi:hypothetical protein
MMPTRIMEGAWGWLRTGVIFGHGQRGALDEDGLILPVSDSEPQTRSRLSLPTSSLRLGPWAKAPVRPQQARLGWPGDLRRATGGRRAPRLCTSPEPAEHPPKSKSAPGLPRPSGHWQRELQAERCRRGGIVGAQVRAAAARIDAFCHLTAR